MAENYKHLYEQMKKMVEMYQDEIVPGLRKQIEELEKNQVKVRCKDCENSRAIKETDPNAHEYAEGCVWCMAHDVGFGKDDFCSYGERREG